MRLQLSDDAKAAIWCVEQLIAGAREKGCPLQPVAVALIVQGTRLLVSLTNREFAVAFLQTVLDDTKAGGAETWTGQGSA